MKRILCVAILMGLTTALHAVTYTWDATAQAFKNGTEKLGAYKDISKLVITVECTGKTTTVARDCFAITQADNTNLLKFSVKGQTSGRAQITVTNNSANTGNGQRVLDFGSCGERQVLHDGLHL